LSDSAEQIHHWILSRRFRGKQPISRPYPSLDEARSHVMSANLQVIEHRWGTRIPLAAAAELRTEYRASIDVTVDNASLSGAFVRTAARLPLLSCVFIHVHEGPDEWLEACVVRHDEVGMGLEWLDPGLAVCALLTPQREVPLDRTG
jgi:hypothetical protein